MLARRAVSAHVAHGARLHAHKMTKKQARPRGNYDHAPFQFGVVHAVNAGPPPSVDLYLDGSQTLGSTSYLTAKVAYLSSYYPAVGDVVLVRRGQGRSNSDRMVLGKAAGAASPYGIPLGGINSVGQYSQGPNMLWGGSGLPPGDLGAEGDYYLRTDTPGTASQRLYVKTSSTVWTATSV